MDPLMLLAACIILLIAMLVSYWMMPNPLKLEFNAVLKSISPNVMCRNSPHVGTSFDIFRTGTVILEDLTAVTIPGPVCADKINGHTIEIGMAGSLHEYLTDQHGKYGPIVGVWMGKLCVVSVASPASFKKLAAVFERPPELFQLFLPLITEKSITYANYEDGRKRRHPYDQALSHAAISRLFKAFQKVTDDVVYEWSKVGKDDHIPLHRTMLDLAIRGIGVAGFGEYFQDGERTAKFQDGYNICWSTMEESISKGFPKPGTQRFKQFEKGRLAMHNLVKDIVEKKRASTIQDRPTDRLFLDVLMELDNSRDRIFPDALDFVIGGFHTTGYMLTWALYYLARDQSIQEKLAEEIKSVLGGGTVDETNISELKYLRQVQDETLRCSVLVPWGAKYLDEDTYVEGYRIPAKTPIITSLGTMLQDSRYWPNPTRFDPDRFTPENIRRRPAHAFAPFGLPGKRICPGYRFAYTETAVVLATLVQQFRIELADNSQKILPVFGFVTKVNEEVWITLSKRELRTFIRANYC